MANKTRGRRLRYGCCRILERRRQEEGHGGRKSWPRARGQDAPGAGGPRRLQILSSHTARGQSDVYKTMFIESILETDNTKRFWVVSSPRARSRDSFLSLKRSPQEILAYLTEGEEELTNTTAVPLATALMAKMPINVNNIFFRRV